MRVPADDPLTDTCCWLICSPRNSKRIKSLFVLFLVGQLWLVFIWLCCYPAVRDIIPLGGPRHARVDDKRSRHSKPDVLSLEPPQKANQTQRIANPFSRQALILEKPKMKMQVPSVLLKRIPNSSSTSLAATGSASLSTGAVHRDPGYRSSQVRSRSLEVMTSVHIFSL